VPKAQGFEHLWAPWRMEYILAATKSEAKGKSRAAKVRRTRSPKPEECLFCRVAAERRKDRENLVIARPAGTIVMLNRFPYNPAHLMVAPTRHVATIAGMTDDERAALMTATALAERALQKEYEPHGMNYGANLGRIAGAGFPGHFHLHLVPRWNGDTNFMPTIADTRVLPESLARTWTRLRAAVRRIEGPRGR
jgi:ATP adenylyltransferase